MICVRAAVKRYQVGVETVTAVDGVDLDVQEGAFACLYGASGSGKSTLLNLVAGLDTPDSGQVTVAGLDVAHAAERHRAQIRLTTVGVVFQDHNLVAEFTAGENVYLSLLARGMAKTAAVAAAEEALARVGIAELFGRRPLEMSGGQRQRVGSPARSSGAGGCSSRMSRPAPSIPRTRKRCSRRSRGCAPIWA
ncbi:ABC transporter ATP-binding protein [Actinokineospora sp. NPDC004072]